MVSILTLGCGKKADEESEKNPYRPQPQLPEIEQELLKQDLFCGDDRSCPSYLTKIAFAHRDKLKFCTGFLIDDDVVVTASSCLPERLRIENMDCKRDAYFFFANSNEKPTRLGCKKILKATQLSEKEPFLWRSDIAYIQIEKDADSSERKTVSPNRSGMNDLDKFYIWSIDQIDDHQGIIRKSESCQSVHNSYFNPLAVNESSPVMTIAGCEYNEGNGGAPIIDYRGRIRGVLSKPIDKAEIDEVISMRVLVKPLKHLVHATNYACAPMLPEQDVLNESECNKKLDLSSYDRGQVEMTNETSLFKSAVQRLEHAANEQNIYLKIAVNLNGLEDGYVVDFFPKCFKNVSKWINDFTNNKPFTSYINLPLMKIKRSMNEFGRIYAQEIVRTVEVTKFQFRPSYLRSDKKATVFKWVDFNEPVTYPKVPESCDLLL